MQPTSRKPGAVQAHNERIRWFVKNRLVHVARYALIYPVKGSRPRRVLLPSKDGWDPACGASASTEDLELGQWFRGPQKVNSVDYFPGTRCRLGNGYDIVFAKCRKRQRPPPINATILSLFSIRWPGALVIIKRARRDYGRVVHITAPEISLINAITQRWLESRGSMRI